MDPLDNTNAQYDGQEKPQNNDNRVEGVSEEAKDKIDIQKTPPSIEEKPLSPSQPAQSQQTAQSQPTVSQPVDLQQPAHTNSSQTTQANNIDAPIQDNEKLDVEYINRAEHIIDEHKEDPYTEDEQEDKLSQEFLKKKFNLDVDDPKG